MPRMGSPSIGPYHEVTDMTSAAAKRLDPIRLPTADELQCDDGGPMETIRYANQMNLLIESLKLGTKGRDDLFVSGNNSMYYSPFRSSANCPKNIHPRTVSRADSPLSCASSIPRSKNAAYRSAFPRGYFLAT